MVYNSNDTVTRYGIGKTGKVTAKNDPLQMVPETLMPVDMYISQNGIPEDINEELGQDNQYNQ
jgi:hypothetical protein